MRFILLNSDVKRVYFSVGFAVFYHVFKNIQKLYIYQGSSHLADNCSCHKGDIIKLFEKKHETEIMGQRSKPAAMQSFLSGILDWLKEAI